MEDSPNARIEDDEGEIKYKTIGDNLKIRYKAERKGGWLNYSSANLHVELNGQPLTTCVEVRLDLRPENFPRTTLVLDLESIDIDADTMTALQAIIEAKEKNGKR
jgi:hypothetical protein